MIPLKPIVKRALRTFGLDVRLIRNVERAERKDWDHKWLHDARALEPENIRTIIDIGANVGQFARLAHALCPAAKIYSFEPLPTCYAELEKVIRGIPGSEAIQCAVGADSGIVNMHQSEFSPSSSLLEMTDLHKQNWPESAQQHTVSVEVRRLDDVMATRPLDDDLLVKMDAQGFEDRVIRGGVNVISRARVVLAEVSFAELYTGQPLFGDIHELLRELGFVYRGNLEQHWSKLDGRILFADAIFSRGAGQFSAKGAASS